MTDRRFEIASVGEDECVPCQSPKPHTVQQEVSGELRIDKLERKQRDMLANSSLHLWSSAEKLLRGVIPEIMTGSISVLCVLLLLWLSSLHPLPASPKNSSAEEQVFGQSRSPYVSSERSEDR